MSRPLLWTVPIKWCDFEGPLDISISRRKPVISNFYRTVDDTVHFRRLFMPDFFPFRAAHVSMGSVKMFTLPSFLLVSFDSFLFVRSSSFPIRHYLVDIPCHTFTWSPDRSRCPLGAKAWWLETPTPLITSNPGANPLMLPETLSLNKSSKALSCY